MVEVPVILLEAALGDPGSTIGAIIAVAICAALCTEYWGLGKDALRED
jgi:hypothetical protein